MEDQTPRDIDERLQQELLAVQITLLAIINTHPDKKTLLRTFDSITAAVQVNNAVSNATPSTHPMLREALERFRSQIAI